MCASSSLLSGLFLASYLCLLKKKNRKERICPNSIKITHSTHHKTTVIKLINIFINISIKNGIINLCNKKCINHHQNITVDEKLAIKNLKANQDIIIQSAGEGGEIVIMNRNQYIKECKKQLLDSTFQKQTDDCNLQKQNTNLGSEIRNLKANNYISEKEYKFLSKLFHSSRTPIFYELPKIHKFFEKSPPLRPIVSGFNCISASLSEYADSFLKYHGRTCKSYIRDTLDFSLKFKSLFSIPSTSILGTMDVNSLYTNIDYDEGADACYKNLETHKNKTLPSSTFKNCILLSLKSNIFQFCNFSYSKNGDNNGYRNAC